MIKILTKKEIIKANKHNPCFLKVCPQCGCNVIEQQIAQSHIFIMEAFVSNCPKCSYSFTN